jgi:hypothetical protein
MKKFSMYSISFYVLFFLLSLTLRAQINPNGGFETGTPGVHTGSEVTGWDFQLGGTADAVFEIVTDPEYVYSGNQALQVTVNAIGSNAWEPQIINTSFAVQSSTTYSISAWAKADLEGALANFTMGSLAPNYYEWGRISNVVLGLDWQHVTFQATTRNPETEPVGGIPIHFGVASNQAYLPITFYIDDVEVTSPNGIGNSEDKVPVLDKYSLAQNYPNPFNPTTTIEFSLPVSGNIHLVLIDMLGRVVRDIANGTYEAGTHKVTLNLSDMTSGVYFYRLEAGSFVSTKKLALIK